MKFSAHRCVLSAQSAVFRALLYGKMRESKRSENVLVEDVDPATFSVIIEYCYTCSASITPDNATSLLYAAKKYHLPHLEADCAKFLTDALDDNNCCLILQQADLFNDEALQKQCRKYIIEHARAVMKTSGIGHLPLRHLQDMVECDELALREVFIYLTIFWFVLLVCSVTMYFTELYCIVSCCIVRFLNFAHASDAFVKTLTYTG